MTDGAPSSGSGPAQTSGQDPRPLASAFEPADRAAWLALVDKALKGADFEKRLVGKTADGIRIEPIYAPNAAQSDPSVPGHAPFKRGTKSEVAGLGWQIHQLVTDQDPQAANRTILEELEAGTNGIVLQVASPGQSGVAIQSSADFITTLTGTYLDYAPVQLKAGTRDLETARHFIDAVAALDQDPKTICAHLNIDPLGTWSRLGCHAKKISDALSEAVTFARGARATAPKLRTINVDATHAHEAGASEGQELAVLAATFVAYLKAFEAVGVAPADAVTQIGFTLSTNDDIFTTLAKLRAARRIIARIANAAGAGDAVSAIHITARTSERMLATRDPWTNILRTTVACAAAAFANTDAITVHPFTWALGQPDRFARRIARNTQIVCQEESSLGRIVDPAGGSWYVEKLTDDVAQAAWSKFQHIESQGGIGAVLLTGTLQEEIKDVRMACQTEVALGKQPLTGVSEFPILGDDGVKVSPWDAQEQPTGTAEITPLTPHRLTEAFEALRDDADQRTSVNGAPPRVFLANIGRIVDHNARSTWIKNFLAAGGIEALTNDGFEDAEKAAAAFKASGATAVCICSSDALYQQHAIATANALKTAGADLVLLAGKPGDAEADLKAAGVDQFLFAGNNAIDTLSNLLNKIG